MQQKLETLAGFKRYALLFALGAFGVLAMPPVGIFPALVVSVTGFIWMAGAAPTRTKAFLCGWAFGAGYFIFGFYWISAALFVDIARWVWVMPFSLVAGPGLMGLYWGLAALAAHGLRGRAVYPLAVVLALAVAEYARGHLLTGFPWNLPGYAFDRFPAMEQTASVTGVYGLSLLVLFWSAFPAYRRCRVTAAVAATTFAAAFIFGAVRLGMTPTVFTEHGVRVVQAHIEQNQKFDGNSMRRHFEKYLALTALSSDIRADIVVWPETAVVADLESYPDLTREIAAHMQSDAIGVLGSLRVVEGKDGQETKYYNSVTLMTAANGGAVLDNYDKHHLVPFGEYIPYRHILNITPIGLAISGLGDFSRGTGPRTVTPDGLPAFSPLICYEVIFPAEAADPQNRPGWLVNVTNDAWYGHSAGPYQHLAISRMRAIEQGLPLVRAANTGISAIIDPMGRITASRALGETGIIDGYLPEALSPPLYARLGDGLFFAMLAAGIAALFFRTKKTGDSTS